MGENLSCWLQDSKFKSCSALGWTWSHSSNHVAYRALLYLGNKGKHFWVLIVTGSRSNKRASISWGIYTERTYHVKFEMLITLPNQVWIERLMYRKPQKEAGNAVPETKSIGFYPLTCTTKRWGHNRNIPTSLGWQQSFKRLLLTSSFLMLYLNNEECFVKSTKRSLDVTQ